MISLGRMPQGQARVRYRVGCFLFSFFPDFSWRKLATKNLITFVKAIFETYKLPSCRFQLPLWVTPEAPANIMTVKKGNF